MKAGFAAIVGRPNVGKSTFLNRALGRKVAIVSRKPGTTRMRVLGIRNTPGAQTVFIDTPGAPSSDSLLSRYLRGEIEAARHDVDLLLFMTDPTPRAAERDAKLLEGLFAPAMFLVINKVDRVARPELLPLIDQYRRLREFQEVFPISARTGENVEELLRAVEGCLPEGEPYFPPEVATSQAEEEMAAELIREQVIEATGEELPYAAAVTVEALEADEDRRRLVVAATLYVEKESQKPILIGRGGRMIKQIGAAARRSLEEHFGTHVFLDLHVKVKKDWSRSERSLKELGFGRT
ncbi:MAG: GTPase Era [Candidatus Tectomicrobia bacterium]|nr:GTPase Era [Candidatus Tectomicrobia bacterium]